MVGTIPNMSTIQTTLRDSSFQHFVSIHDVGPSAKLDSRLSGLVYVELLDTVFVDYIKSTFGTLECYWIDDNCPAHTLTIVSQWFECCNALHGINLKLIRLPAYSPDLNIIENFWGYTQFELLYDRTMTTYDQLWIAVSRHWYRLNSKSYYIAKLIDSVPRRLEEVVRSDGWPIKY